MSIDHQEVPIFFLFFGSSGNFIIDPLCPSAHVTFCRYVQGVSTTIAHTPGASVRLQRTEYGQSLMMLSIHHPDLPPNHVAVGLLQRKYISTF